MQEHLRGIPVLYVALLKLPRLFNASKTQRVTSCILYERFVSRAVLEGVSCLLKLFQEVVSLPFRSIDGVQDRLVVFRGRKRA